jgi:hypothetical protein
VRERTKFVVKWVHGNIFRYAGCCMRYDIIGKRRGEIGTPFETIPSEEERR